MRVTTLDPMTLNDVKDIDNAPFIIEGEGDNAIKIFFESEESKQEYENLEMHGSDNISGLKSIYDSMAENPDTGSIN
jgi:hypothetical protein